MTRPDSIEGIVKRKKKREEGREGGREGGRERGRGGESSLAEDMAVIPQSSASRVLPTETRLSE